MSDATTNIVSVAALAVSFLVLFLALTWWGRRDRRQPLKVTATGGCPTCGNEHWTIAGDDLEHVVNVLKALTIAHNEVHHPEAVGVVPNAADPALIDYEP